MPSTTRRELLALAAGGLTAAAGCLARDVGTGSTTSTTTRSTTTTATTTSTTGTAPDTPAPAPSCADGYTSLDPWWVVEGPGPLGGFELSLDSDSIARGETLAVALTNVSDEERTTGNRKKYDVQYRGEDGWHTILGTEDDSAAWTDEGILHAPGDGFTWEFTFTRDGLSNAVDHGPVYHVCVPLDPGTYRFVYWGVTPPKEEAEDFETDYALGVEFAATED